MSDYYEDESLFTAASGESRVTGFKTLAHMTPAEAEIARRDAIAWGKLATRDHCHRCAGYYDDHAVTCVLSHRCEHLECDNAAVEGETLCAKCLAIKIDARRTFEGAVRAGWIEEGVS